MKNGDFPISVLYVLPGRVDEHPGLQPGSPVVLPWHRKVVLDGKTFAPFGMLPHAVEPVKVDPAPVGPRWAWSSYVSNGLSN